jgi:hypothetical protein
MARSLFILRYWFPKIRPSDDWDLNKHFQKCVWSDIFPFLGRFFLALLALSFNVACLCKLYSFKAKNFTLNKLFLVGIDPPIFSLELGLPEPLMPDVGLDDCLLLLGLLL